MVDQSQTTPIVLATSTLVATLGGIYITDQSNFAQGTIALTGLIVALGAIYTRWANEQTRERLAALTEAARIEAARIAAITAAGIASVHQDRIAALERRLAEKQTER